MAYTTMCGVDYTAYFRAQLEGKHFSRIDYHCERCGQVFGLIAVSRPITELSIFDQEKCQCGCNSVIVDDVFIGGERLQRHPTPYETRLAQIMAGGES